MPTEDTKTATETEATAAETTETEMVDVNKIVKQHALVAAGVGFLPLPIVDYVALIGVQLNLLRKLAEIYDVPFFEDKVKHLITPLVGAAFPGLVGGPLMFSLTKFIPFLGSTVGIVTMPILGGATTYAVGKVFIQHFASGGTFLTFDPEKVKAYYAQMFEEGKKVAAETKS